MIVKISVRNLIEFLMRSGDIDNSFRDNNRMIKGIRAHQKIQESYGKNFKKEVSLKNKTSLGGVDFEVEGRADGILYKNGSYMVDEIKSTTRPLSQIDGENKLHWAQAKCYGYFLIADKNLESISISLTYVSTEDYRNKVFKKDFSKDDLNDFYMSLLGDYLNFSKIISTNISMRNETANALAFPFENYRKGQRKMAVGIYRAILDEKKLFIDAPTGIGKTISSIFPAIKSFGENLSDKVFYLTSKTTTGKEALKAIKLLVKKGLYIRAIQLSSKERICLNDEVKCNPKDCPFAKGHYDRVNSGLVEILANEDILGFDLIRSYAEKYRLCPFELQLDLSTYSDFIICDYNYVFDPNVYLRRFFEDNLSEFIFLIDEAHNLLDRSRDMYSASLKDIDFILLKDYFDIKKHKIIIKNIDHVIDYFSEAYKKYGQKLVYYTSSHLDTIDEKLLNLQSSLEKFLIIEKDHKAYDEILKIYFDINRYLRISENFTGGFYNVITYKDIEDIKIFEIKCVDPSSVLKNKYNLARSSIFFSATLSPLRFFINLLGAKDSLKLRLNSPFDPNKQLVIQKSISTRYQDRKFNREKIVQEIEDFVSAKKGNYFIFFPSFKYLNDVADFYKKRYKREIIIQDANMSQKQRKKFLDKFSKSKANIGFVVLGGIFSEGVDLIGDRLIGAMIISVGMPGLSFDRDLIKKHFDQEGLNGFDYSYTYPGINKVFQAIGRVIRSESDRGIIYLIDDRYRWDKYIRLFPRTIGNIHYLEKDQPATEIISKFWSENEKKTD
ncbi:MAG: ATP-dependent DNA helicase [Anaerococcus sp.]|nr:ATP-dependent DNA helicase [Anaerococcus sp.]